MAWAMLKGSITSWIVIGIPAQQSLFRVRETPPALASFSGNTLSHCRGED
jgi:hypothetical protein